MSVQTEIDSFKAKRLSQTGSTVEQAMVNLEEALQGLEDNKAEKAEVAQSFTDVSNTLNLKADLVNGVVKSEQLPAFVKNIENAYYYNNQFYDDEAHTILITPSTETIYIDITGGGTNQYRWSGTAYILMGTGQLVTITTDGLMSYLDKIKLNGIAEGAVKVELSLVNGNILVNGIEFQVYRIADNEVTNVKLAQMPTKTFKGNKETTTENVQDLTITEAQDLIFSDDSHLPVSLAEKTQWNASSSVIRFYDTRALAIADEANISVGNYIETMGSSTINDGLGGEYVVGSTLTDTTGGWQIGTGKYANRRIKNSKSYNAELTGVPISTTATAGTSSTQIATTAFVNSMLGGNIVPAKNLAASGYVKMANGLILQWIKIYTGTAAGKNRVNFPVAFPNALLNVQVTDQGMSIPSSADLSWDDTSSTKSYADIYATSGSYSFALFAIGY